MNPQAPPRRSCKRTALLILLGVALLFALLLVGGYFYLSRSESGTRFIWSLAGSKALKALPGKFTVGGVGGTLNGRLTLVDLCWISPRGDSLVRADSISADISIRGLLRRVVTLTNPRLDGGTAYLSSKDSLLNWQNIFTASPDTVQVKPSAPWDIILNKAELRKCQFVWRNAAAPLESLRCDFALKGSAHFGRAFLIALDSVTIITQPGLLPSAAVNGAFTWAIDPPKDSTGTRDGIVVPRLRLEMAGATLEASGGWFPVGDSVRLAGTLHDLTLRPWRAFLDTANLRPDTPFQLDFKGAGRLDSLPFDVTLTTGLNKIKALGTWFGGSDLDVRTEVNVPSLGTVVKGLPDTCGVITKATLRFKSKQISGDLRNTELTWGKEHVRLDSLLVVRRGTHQRGATSGGWRGASFTLTVREAGADTVDLDYELEVDSLLVPYRKQWPRASARLKGTLTGSKPADSALRKLSTTFSGSTADKKDEWTGHLTVAGDRATLSDFVSDGRIGRIWIDAGYDLTQNNGSGRIQLLDVRPGREFPALRALLLRGSVRGQVDLTLRPDSTRLAFEIYSDSLSLKGKELDTVALTGELLGRDTTWTGQFMATVARAKIGSFVLPNGKVEAGLNGPPWAGTYDINLDGPDGQPIHSAGDWAYLEDSTVVTLRETQIQLGFQPMRVIGDPRIVVQNDGIHLRSLQVLGARTRIEADGVWGTTGKGTFSIKHLPLGVLTAWAPSLIGIGGDLGLSGAWRPDGIDLKGAISKLEARGVSLDTLAFDIALDTLKTELALAAKLDSLVMARIEGTYPYGWYPESSTVRPMPGEMALRLTTPQLDLAQAGRIIAGMNGSAGKVVTDVAVRGTSTDPHLDGTLSLDNGTLRYESTGTALDHLSVNLALSDSLVTLREFTGSDPSGHVLDGNGWVRLNRWKQQSGHFIFSADDVTLASTRKLLARASGNIYVDMDSTWTHVTGDLSFGRIQVAGDSYQGVKLRPVLLPDEIDTSSVPKKRALWDMNIGLHFPEELIISSPDYFVRLSGDLQVMGRGDTLQIFGTLSAKEGWYTLYSRKFTIEDATITFAGEVPFNPTLNIQAVFKAGDTTTIHLAISNRMRSPQLVLTSDPFMAQQDILATLIVGRPTGLTGIAQGGSPGKVDLGGMLLSQTIGLVAGEVAGAIQLTEFQIAAPTSGGNLSGTEVTVGAYLSDRLFVRVKGSLSGDVRSTEAAMRYRLTKTFLLEGYQQSDGSKGADLILQWKF